MASNIISLPRVNAISSGDVSMLQGTSILGSCRVTSDEAEILHIPAAELRRALAEIPDVSKTIVDALIMRRRRLSRDREFAGMRVLANRDARDGHQLDDFLDKNRIPHRLIDFESEQGKALGERFHLTSRDLPVLITPAGARLRRPSLREVAQGSRFAAVARVKKMKPKFSATWPSLALDRLDWPQRCMPRPRD